MCLLSPVDLAKVSLLRENINYTALFLGIVGCVQNFLSGLFFDLIIFLIYDQTFDERLDRYYPSKVFEIVLTVITAWLVYRHMKAEMRELEVIKRSENENEQNI